MVGIGESVSLYCCVVLKIRYNISVIWFLNGRLFCLNGIFCKIMMNNKMVDYGYNIYS